MKYILNRTITATYQLTDDGGELHPEKIHIIKTGFNDIYMLIHEDAYHISIGTVEYLSRIKKKKKYNIKLTI